MLSSIAACARFEAIRYGQCWEDADVLLKALAVQPGHVCLSIASAGDNTLALLACQPARLIALDLSPAQLACLELRVAAYRELEHPELLELMGSRESKRREGLYQRCRPLLSQAALAFWDAHRQAIRQGIGRAGKFERYFSWFRRYLLPCVHSEIQVERLLRNKPLEERQAFYQQHWDNWRWRCLFHLFFSRWVMGHLGRDPEFFKYVEGRVAARILERTRYGLAELNPAENPYVHWILTGTHREVLPFALRPENFQRIRAHLASLEWRRQSVEDFLAENPGQRIDRFNLSDIFEYVSESDYHRLLENLLAASKPQARLVYWNMLARRRRPEYLAPKLRPLEDLAQELFRQDKAFFYSALVIEEVL